MKTNKYNRFKVSPDGLYIDFGFWSVNKRSEAVCGDYYTIMEGEDSDILVLSDGQGSGIRANIPATLTAKMLGKMIAGEVPLEEAVEAVARTLPVNSVSGLSYATFTVLKMGQSEAQMLEFDNPDAILIRDGQVQKIPARVTEIAGKEIFERTVHFREGDTLIITSDGVSNAGMGKITGSGWKRSDLERFVERKCEKTLCARELAVEVGLAVRDLEMGEHDDDVTVLVLRFVKPEPVNLMIGPPGRMDDTHYVKRFFRNPGRHITCGGTTTKVAASYLEKDVKIAYGTDKDDLPCMLKVSGIDLATEGQLTLDRLLEYLEEYTEDPLSLRRIEKIGNGASCLMQELLGSCSQINVFFGNAANEAYEELKVSLHTKQETVEELIRYLENAGKKIHIELWAV